MTKPTTQILNKIEGKDHQYWEQVRKEGALRLFREMAKSVPAYKRFLKDHSVSSGSIRTYDDLVREVPVSNKSNYLKKYPYTELFRGGSVAGPFVYTATSGSTGEPFYFARNEEIDWQCSVTQEFFLMQGGRPNDSTLVIVCFGMGLWIGGLITFNAFHLLAKRGYPISVITPGINKTEIFRALKNLSPKYQKTILCGYPPFMKDIIDESRANGIDLKKLNIRVSMAAEPFSEGFRDYIAREAGIADPLRHTTNIYGSADIGAMAFETPLSVALRRHALTNKTLAKYLWGRTEKTPTLAQFIPNFINFESLEGELLLSGNSAMPLLRYAIGDNGGVLSYDEAMKRSGTTTAMLLKKTGGRGQGDPFIDQQLPFVYIFERNDFSTTLYGLQVYPETIKDVLIRTPFSKLLTGKFTLVTRYDADQNQILEINLELRPDKQASRTFSSGLQEKIIKNLVSKNAEFKELLSYLGKRAHPKLVFWPAGDPLYFKPGTKQGWVKKTT